MQQNSELADSCFTPPRYPGLLPFMNAPITTHHTHTHARTHTHTHTHTLHTHKGTHTCEPTVIICKELAACIGRKSHASLWGGRARLCRLFRLWLYEPRACCVCVSHVAVDGAQSLSLTRCVLALASFRARWPLGRLWLHVWWLCSQVRGKRWRLIKVKRRCDVLWRRCWGTILAKSHTLHLQRLYKPRLSAGSRCEWVQQKCDVRFRLRPHCCGFTSPSLPPVPPPSCC